MSCINCEYARRAENNEYVGCCLLVKLSYMKKIVYVLVG